MKPFDLKAALAGAPVVTRDGKTVVLIGQFPGTVQPNVWADLEGSSFLYWFYENGRVHEHDEHAFDLFMAPRKEKRWIGLSLADGWCSRAYKKESEAQEFIDSRPFGDLQEYRIIEIEIEV